MDVTGYKARCIDGKWHAVVYWKDNFGKRHQKSTRIHVDSEKDAERSALDFYIMCRSGEIQLTAERNDDAFSFAERYFKGRLDRREYERSTYATNMKHMRAWKSALGERSLPKISEKDVKDAIETWFAEGRDATTVDKRITALKEVFKAAMLEGACRSNPLENVKRPKKGWKVLNGCNDSSLRDDLMVTLANLPLDSMKVAFNLAFWTGMRRGEICALQWVNVDFESGVIWVRHSIGADDYGTYVKLPKSDRPRDIAIPSHLLAILSEWKSVQRKKHGSLDQLYVVCDDSGNHMHPDYITHAFTHLARFKGWEGAAGRRMTLHDLRHTVATALISEGADVKTVQSVLGHSSAAITLDMYASADRGAKKKAAALLDGIASRRSSERLCWVADPSRKEVPCEEGRTHSNTA